MAARRVKASYTIDGYNKFVVGTVVDETPTFIKVQSDTGAVIEIARKNIDEIIHLNSGGGR